MIIDVAGEPLVKLENLSVEFRASRAKRFGRRPKFRAVDGITMTIRPGETMGLVGETGSGKTTLGRALLRLVPASSGSVRFGGIDITTMPERRLRAIRPDLQVVFQDSMGSLDPRRRVEHSVAEPLRARGGVTKKEQKTRVQELLDTVGLSPEIGRRYPFQLSGGQRQRIALARAISASPRLLVCDEPISGLDVSAQGHVINLLRNLRAEFNVAYLFIGHDLAAMRLISDRISVMYCGQIVESGEAATVYASPRHPYTKALLSGVPADRDSLKTPQQAIILKGDIPSPLNPPAGCRFRTRCWLYEQLGHPEVCHTPPPKSEATGKHMASCHFPDQVEAGTRLGAGVPHKRATASHTPRSAK
jgi:oligopeptide/dipeptide ABC transporter ATP-binding protein